MVGTLEEHIVRIVRALKHRAGRAFIAPSVEELRFIEITENHGEFCASLRSLGHNAAAESVEKNAVHVGFCWLRLGMEHLDEARAALVAIKRRSTYSRSYYAAYNVSKAVRYIVNGEVSLKGDDHHSASDLPGDFPDGDRWSTVITTLYEHRLMADYDN
jgi:hypothetical protein